ncbi:hypothetical protein Tco_0324916 [Tanacetum coccineum]
MLTLLQLLHMGDKDLHCSRWPVVSALLFFVDMVLIILWKDPSTFFSFLPLTFQHMHGSFSIPSTHYSIVLKTIGESDDSPHAFKVQRFAFYKFQVKHSANTCAGLGPEQYDVDSHSLTLLLLLLAIWQCRQLLREGGQQQQELSPTSPQVVVRYYTLGERGAAPTLSEQPLRKDLNGILQDRASELKQKYRKTANH